MKAAGMTTRLDPVANVIGRYEAATPDQPALLLGSHLDTVVNAGRYDGALGVVLPIVCVEHLHRRGERLPFAIEIIAFGDEEGVRFQSTLIGSRAVAGTLDPALLAKADCDGITLGGALETFGLNPNSIAQATRTPDDILAYVEVHIEQGPVLEAEELPVGVVTSIAGATRMAATVTGLAGHAGTVPMTMRQDALAGAAEMILYVETRCSAPETVGTVGQIDAQPGAVNVIPGSVQFSIDVRAGDDGCRLSTVADIRQRFEDIASRRGLGTTVVETHANPSCTCDPALMEKLATAVAAEGFDVCRLPSGAGHDAMALADLTPVAMLFVRCEHGVSHHPAESMTAEDADAAARVLLNFLRNFHLTR
jgi:allantoate deiminase